MACPSQTLRRRDPCAAILARLLAAAVVMLAFAQHAAAGDVESFPPRAPEPVGTSIVPAKPVKLDQWGDPLPDYATARLVSNRFRHRFGTAAVVKTPDEKHVVSIDSATVRVWDSATGHHVHSLSFLFSNKPELLAVSPDGSVLAVLFPDLTVGLYRWGDFARIGTLPAPSDFKNYLGGRLGFGFSDKGDALRLWTEYALLSWNVAKRESKPSREYESRVVAYSIRTDAVALRSSEPAGCYIHRSANQNVINAEAPEGATAPEWGLFSPDGKALAITWTTVRLVATPFGPEKEFSTITTVVDAHTGKEIASLGPGGYRSAFSGDGKRIATSVYPNTHVWDLSAKQLIQKIPLFSKHTLFFKDGKELLSSTRTQLVRWDVRTGRPLTPDEIQYSQSTVRSFSPSGKLLAEAGAGVRVTSVDGNRLLWNLPASKDNFAQVTFCPNGHEVACLHRTAVSFFDVQTGVVSRLKAFGPSPADEVSLAPNGEDVAAAYGEEVRLLEGPSLMARTLGTAPDRVSDLVFSPDGFALLVQADGLFVWPLTGTSAPAPLSHAGKHLRNYRFSANGQFLIAITSDDWTNNSGVVTQWEVASLDVVFQHRFETTVPRKIVLHPDGRTILVATHRNNDEIGESHNTWAFDLLGQREPRFIGIPGINTVYPNGREAIADDPTELAQLVVTLPSPILPRAASTADKRDDVASIWKNLRSASFSSRAAVDHVARLDAQGVAQLRERLTKSIAAHEANVSAAVATVASSTGNDRDKSIQAVAAFGLAGLRAIEAKLSVKASNIHEADVAQVRRRVASYRINDSEELRQVRAAYGLSLNRLPEARELLKWMAKQSACPNMAAAANCALTSSSNDSAPNDSRRP